MLASWVANAQETLGGRVPHPLTLGSSSFPARP
jgi:hypothetical protein